ncbi:Ldh family oxidoreductase [Amycolatopsis sp. CA-230715]|uniref:Ldh family oxidoreductase n=1 Tax=Amycolatopsis sp. CA-230715 TaxID=2745196 RepID=UPI001C015258|nr:Ldh family oxidoreductase [Amycolatopsis sp. CA-230715]QWF78430.1 2,3-diketo-L-gulonate reductase [Amycolatopsis sp. CA-230715]
MPFRPLSFRQSRPVPVEPPPKIPEQARLRVVGEDLVAFAASVFAAYDLPPERARIAAHALCYGDLAGVKDCGVAELIRTYLPLFDEGQVRPRAEPLVIADRGAAAMVDYRKALGLWAVSDAMDRAVVRAARYGVGLLSVRGVSAFGRAAHHASRALSHGMIGVVLAAGGDQGVNPLGIAAPGGDYAPFVFDATADALTSTGPQSPAAGFALMVEVLAGVLSGVGDHDRDTGLLVLAIAPPALRSADGFARAASALFGSLLGWDSGVGGTPIRYPGWKESQFAEQCEALGVPMSPALYRELNALAGQLGIPMPPAT